jgi:ABC-2 type transport system permease protein
MDLVLILRSPWTALTWLVTDFFSYTSGVAAVLLLAERFEGIAGWSRGQLVFLVGFSTTSAALRQTLFGYNLSAISRRVGRGQLDHVLVQPRSIMACFLTEGFSPFSSLGALLPGVVLLVAGARLARLGADPGSIAATAVCLVSSMTIVLAGSFALGAAAFWAPRGAEEISTRAGNLLSVSDFPLDPVPRGLRTVLLTVIPAGFVAWFPASALLQRRPFWEWSLTPLAALVALTLAAWIFTKGLRRYVRTGSSRYSDFGHRR